MGFLLHFALCRISKDPFWREKESRVPDGPRGIPEVYVFLVSGDPRMFHFSRNHMSACSSCCYPPSLDMCVLPRYNAPVLRHAASMCFAYNYAHMMSYILYIKQDCISLLRCAYCNLDRDLGLPFPGLARVVSTETNDSERLEGTPWRRSPCKDSRIAP